MKVALKNVTNGESFSFRPSVYLGREIASPRGNQEIASIERLGSPSGLQFVYSDLVAHYPFNPSRASR